MKNSSRDEGGQQGISLDTPVQPTHMKREIDDVSQLRKRAVFALNGRSSLRHHLNPLFDACTLAKHYTPRLCRSL